MSVQLARTRRFPVSASALYSVLTCRAYYDARFAMSGVTDYGYEEEQMPDGALLIRLTRQMDVKSGKVPAFARRFIGRSAALISEFVWQPGTTQPFRAGFRFSMGSVPVTVAGSMTLSEDGAGHAQQDLEADITSSVPLLGRKLAQLVADQVDKGLASDSRATLRYLEEQGMLTR
ncbi:DUF2505 domain-containing protein [Alcanivorax sp. JB21]|uniref:DUF2505 domain-containing protein n=1 Tax=Alcanivorax limicola TaxID=2874102 RepID=UPI001CBEC841|nr:DUF2505 domain-containing protein [Alcanivorax limicola]MBZ2187650.1 DUF2505 domain-containing protein [Alcanivorax limicola]